MKLHKMKDIITKNGIENLLNSVIPTEVYESVGSTNTLLKQRAKNGASSPLLLVASHQSEGHGRMGRCFFSPDNSGIYMSLLLKPDLTPDKLTLVTTAAAVAVCRAIEQLTPQKPAIKWVNDVYIHGRKVCGILTEGVFLSESVQNNYAVLGIGLNVYPPQNGFPDEIQAIAGHITDNIQPDFKNKLIATIINNFFKIWQTDFTPEYKERLFILGKEIKVISPVSTRNAIALDIDNMCRLKVRYDDGTEEMLSSGEISIRV